MCCLGLEAFILLFRSDLFKVSKYRVFRGTVLRDISEEKSNFVRNADCGPEKAWDRVERNV